VTRLGRAFPPRLVMLEDSVAILPFTPGGVHGGGAVNVITQDLDASEHWLAGGDVAGVLGTSDGAKSWAPSAAGITGRPPIACVVQDPSNHSTWYTGQGVQSGVNQATGGFLKSTDGGKTWTLTASPPVFCGNGNLAQEAGTGGPRSVGRLIVPAGGSIYAGSFSDGVYKSTDGGGSFSPLGSLGGALVRCLVSDPGSPTTKFWVGLHDPSYAVSSASWDQPTQTATIVTALPHNYSTGTTVKVSQVQSTGPGTFNGASFSITVIDETTFSYSLTQDPGTYTGGGAVIDTAVQSLYGLWTVTSTGATSHISMPSAVRTVEEIVWTSTTVGYAACHSAGVYKTTDGGANWAATAALSSLSQWCAMDGYHDSGLNADVLIVGCTNPQSLGGGMYGSLYKTADGGSTWTAITGNSSLIDPTVYGKGFEWWMNTTNQDNLLGRQLYAAHGITRDTSGADRWFIAGRSGIWITTDGGTHWKPAVYHLTVTGHRFAAVDPTNSARVALWSDDWNYFGSVDNLATIVQGSPDGITKTAGIDIADDGVVYVSGGAGATPKVASAPSPVGTFTDLAFPTNLSTPRGLITGRNAAQLRVVLVATTSDGIWALVSGSWSQVCLPSVAFGAAPAASTPPAYFSWPAGLQVVFALDPNTGVMKNIHAGGTGGSGWYVYWPQTTSSDVAQLACDSAGNLYVALGSQFAVITGALSLDDGGQVTQSQIHSKPYDPDAVGITPAGIPYLCTKPTNGVPGSILRSFNQGTDWVDISDDNYKALSENVEAVRPTDHGWVYLGANGNGSYAGSY
jgi:hypothetical protein